VVADDAKHNAAKVQDTNARVIGAPVGFRGSCSK
jgi:hypothetical protein